MKTKTLKKIAIAALMTGVAGTAITAGAHAAGWGPFGKGQRYERMMERFDLNKDGTITQEEANNAAEGRFAAADTDQSGGWSLDEFKAAFAENSKDRQVRAFQRLDKDGDGNVTKEEFDSQTDRLFARLDRNDDGELEMMRGRQGPGQGPGMGRGPGQGPGMGQGQGMGQGPRWQQDDDDDDNRGRGPGMGPRAGQGPNQGQGQGPRWNRDDDNRGGPRWGMHGHGHGQMGHGYMGQGRMGFSGPMGGPGGQRGMNPMGMLFDTFDADNDGKVTRAEFEEVRGKLFASADADGNGSFNLQDFSNIWATINDGRVVRMFQGMDKDGDLTVTAEEHASRSKDLVERMDRNGDGVLTKADFQRGGKGWGGRGDCDGHGRGHGPRDGQGPRDGRGQQGGRW